MATFGNDDRRSTPLSLSTSDGPAAFVGERSPVRRPDDHCRPLLRRPEARLSSLCGEGLGKSVETRREKEAPGREGWIGETGIVDIVCARAGISPLRRACSPRPAWPWRGAPRLSPRRPSSRFEPGRAPPPREPSPPPPPPQPSRAPSRAVSSASPFPSWTEAYARRRPLRPRRARRRPRRRRPRRRRRPNPEAPPPPPPLSTRSATSSPSVRPSARHRLRQLCRHPPRHPPR